MIALIPQILSFLAAIPKIGEMVQLGVAQVVLWYVGQAKADTVSAISDAAALAARATNDEERYQAAESWRKALTRTRYIADK